MGDQIRHSAGAVLWGSPLPFRMVLASDSKTGATGKSPTVEISKNGGAFAAPAGAVSEIGHGWYKVADAVADRDTAGPLKLHATAAACDEAFAEFDIVGYSLTATVTEDVWDIPMGELLADDSVGVAVWNALRGYHHTSAPGGGSAGVPEGTVGLVLAPDGFDDVMIEAGINAPDAIAYILAFAAGVISGAGSGTTTLKNPAGTATRIVATTPGLGNRTSIVLTSPA